MSYIGRGVDAISNVEKLDNITFDGSATYALTKSSAAFTPVGANNILISIDGVIQQGNFSVSTTNIVFDWSPTSSNTCNFILHYGTGVLNVPADGSISAAKMAANSVDSDSYVDGSIDAVHLSANSVDSDAYVDASIDNAHLADDAVGVAELSATGTASSSTFLRGDNSWTAVTSVGGATGVDFNDDVRARFGTGNDLNIWHDNTDSYIKDDGGGDLRIQGDQVKIFNNAGTETKSVYTTDGSVELYHNNVKRLETVSDGINVGGTQDGFIHCTNEHLYFKTDAAKHHIFQTNGANERVRITSDGKVGIGIGSPDSHLHLHNTIDNNVLKVHNQDDTGQFSANVIRLSASRNSTDGSYNILEGLNGGGQRIRVQDSGNVTNTNNSYGSSSDERIKQNIDDASSQWEDIKALKVRKFKLKVDVAQQEELEVGKGEANAPYHIGVIAQELETANMNGLVIEAKPNKEDVAYHSDFGSIDEEGVFTEGQKVKEVKYSVLYMKAIKALQESMERIETLETANTDLATRITALENA